SYRAAPYRHNSGLQKTSRGLCRNSRGEAESLIRAAAHRSQKLDLPRALDALGHCVKAQVGGKPYDCTRYRRIFRRLGNTVNEPAVDLESGDWQVLEMAQARVTGSEIGH